MGTPQQHEPIWRLGDLDPIQSLAKREALAWDELDSPACPLRHDCFAGRMQKRGPSVSLLSTSCSDRWRSREPAIDQPRGRRDGLDGAELATRVADLLQKHYGAQLDLEDSAYEPICPVHDHASVRRSRATAVPSSSVTVDEMEPAEILDQGSQLLAPLMESHGFSLVPCASGKGSGGGFASGEFRRGEGNHLRRLELHFRYSLGLVTYHIGDIDLSHSDYMRGLLGSDVLNQYPGFSDDPLDGFRHLLHDLEKYATDFLHGPGDEFARCAREAERLRAIPGFKRLSELG